MVSANFWHSQHILQIFLNSSKQQNNQGKVQIEARRLTWRYTNPAKSHIYYKR